MGCIRWSRIREELLRLQDGLGWSSHSEFEGGIRTSKGESMQVLEHTWCGSVRRYSIKMAKTCLLLEF